MISKTKTKNIFIAGGNGMVGKAIKRAYEKKLNNGDFKNINILSPSREELDLLNYEDIKKWFEKNKPDVVILAAAKVGGILANSKNPSEFILENLKIQTNLIEISNNFKVDKFLFLGSSCIYPKHANQPIIEEDLLSGPLEKTNEYYSIAKIAGIKLCESLIIQKGFNAICLMPTNLYGPGDNYNLTNSHVMPALIRKFVEAKSANHKSIICWGDGSPLRDFLHVDDLANACLFVLENWNINSINAPKDKNDNPLFWLNVGSNSEISIKKLAQTISSIVGYKGSILWDVNKPNGTPRKVLNTSKINRIGWYPSINLEDGIRLTLKNYEKEIKNNILRT